MAEYTVNHGYTARRDGTTFGPYEPGTTVDLEAADAEWVNRDSPGCLTAVEVAAAPADVDPDGATDPPADRAHKGGRRRAA